MNLVKDLADIPIDVLDLSLRTYNCCARAGMKTLASFDNMTADDIRALKIRCFGVKSQEELIEKLVNFGMKL